MAVTPDCKSKRMFLRRSQGLSLYMRPLPHVGGFFMPFLRRERPDGEKKLIRAFWACAEGE